MLDYKAMYLEFNRKVEQAINMLIEAQQQCEDIYVSDDENVIVELVTSTRRGSDEK